MNDADARAAATTLFLGYPLLKVTKETLDVYQKAFTKMSKDRALQIISRLHITHKDRPPNIGHVIEACMVQNEGARITGEEAYVQLTQAAHRYGRSYGPGDPPPKLDPLIMQALGVWGSWVGGVICHARRERVTSSGSGRVIVAAFLGRRLRARRRARRRVAVALVLWRGLFRTLRRVGRLSEMLSRWRARVGR